MRSLSASPQRELPADSRVTSRLSRFSSTPEQRAGAALLVVGTIGRRRAEGKLALAESPRIDYQLLGLFVSRLLVVLVPLFGFSSSVGGWSPMRERLRANPSGSSRPPRSRVSRTGRGRGSGRGHRTVGRHLAVARAHGTGDGVPAARGEGSDGCRAHRSVGLVLRIR